MFDVMNGFNYQKYLIFAVIQKRHCVRQLADRQSEKKVLCPPVGGKAARKNGPVAEWLGKALQKLLQRFESARDLW